jgi:hypothetical protein
VDLLEDIRKSQWLPFVDVFGNELRGVGFLVVQLSKRDSKRRRVKCFHTLGCLSLPPLENAALSRDPGAAPSREIWT